ncbi:hypothetical protein BBP40_006465 [Aspergillus hancockii]|nr:hypothetical protein BBP40_006465 [Aspergillus hancockii]
METLPKGLVSTTRRVSSELDDIHVVDTSDISRLWKVYNTHPSAHEGDIGYRLENLFWRVWSSDRLQNSMNGSTLAKLFLQISESNSFSISTLQQLKRRKPPSPEKGSDDKPQQKSSNGAKRGPLQPILKKSSAPSGETHKTTRLLLTDLGGQSITRKPSNPPTPVPASQPTMADLNRPTQKKTVFVAGKTKGTKRRPVIMRRKSSQTSSGTSTCAQSPHRTSKLLIPGVRARSPKEKDSSDSEVEALHIEHVVPRDKGSDMMEKPPELPPEFLSNLKDILTDKRSPPQSAKSTPPRWGFVTTDDWTHYDVRYLSPENYEQPSSTSLVNKGFRTRFTEQVDLEKEYLATSVETTTKEGLLQFLQSKSIEIKTGDTCPEQPDSNVEASAVGPSLPIVTPNTDSSTTFSTNSIGRTPSGGYPTLLTPFSLTRGRSQLSLLIEESRKNPTADSQQMSSD